MNLALQILVALFLGLVSPPAGDVGLSADGVHFALDAGGENAIAANESVPSAGHEFFDEEEQDDKDDEVLGSSTVSAEPFTRGGLAAETCLASWSSARRRRSCARAPPLV